MTSVIMRLPKVHLIQPQSLAELLADYESLVQTGEDLVALGRCLKERYVSPSVIKAIENFYIEKGVEPLLRSMNVILTEHSLAVGESRLPIGMSHILLKV